jgi:hypothetical protein
MLANVSNNELILGGDFNLDVIKYQTCAKTSAYIDNLYSNGCIQIVSKPMRICNTAASCIDHFITNCKMDVFNTKILLSNISDHLPIFFNTDHVKLDTKHKNIVTRDFSENNIQRFATQLAMCDWTPISNCNDPEIAFNLFTDQFNHVHTQFFNPKTIRFNKNIHRREKWMTVGLLKSRMNKLNLAKICYTEPSAANKSKYKDYRKTCTINLFELVKKCIMKRF